MNQTVRKEIQEHALVLLKHLPDDLNEYYLAGIVRQIYYIKFDKTIFIRISKLTRTQKNTQNIEKGE